MSAKRVWRLLPVQSVLSPFSVWEHTPVYAHKEYPRYINRPGWQQPATRLALVDESGKEVTE